MNAAAPQLPLPLSGDPEMTLAQFVTSTAQSDLLLAVASGQVSDHLWLSGAPGLGKTHALLALCAAASQSGRRSGYLAASDLASAGPECLDSLDGLEFVAVDNLDLLLDDHWQEAWFHRINRWRDQECQQVFSARQPVAALELALRDLQSRLRQLTDVRLARPTPDQQAEILRRRARARGIELEHGVIRYLLQRQPRGLVHQLALLDALAEQSLVEQRRITVPFVRQFLEKSSSR